MELRVRFIGEMRRQDLVTLMGLDFRPLFDFSPDRVRPEITEMDDGMQGGVRRMKRRAATAGYILRQRRQTGRGD